MNEDLLRQQQQQIEQQHRQRKERMHFLQAKIQRCQDEIAWKIYPQNGTMDIKIEHLQQAMKELIDAVREYHQLNLREEGL